MASRIRARGQELLNLMGTALGNSVRLVLGLDGKWVWFLPRDVPLYKGNLVWVMDAPDQ